MKVIWVAAPLMLIALTSCSTVLKADAVKQLQSQCAAKGMQFVQTHAKQTELLVVSSAEVTGECVGPGDPRYLPAPAKP